MIHIKWQKKKILEILIYFKFLVPFAGYVRLSFSWSNRHVSTCMDLKNWEQVLPLCYKALCYTDLSLFTGIRAWQMLNCSSFIYSMLFLYEFNNVNYFNFIIISLNVLKSFEIPNLKTLLSILWTWFKTEMKARESVSKITHLVHNGRNKSKAQTPLSPSLAPLLWSFSRTEQYKQVLLQ